MSSLSAYGVNAGPVRARRFGVLALAVGLFGLIALVPLSAQVVDPLNPNVPSGSPLGTPGAPAPGAQGNSTIVVAQPSAPPQPVEIDEGRADRSATDDSGDEGTTSSRQGDRRATGITAAQDVVRRPETPSEFERYVGARLGRRLPRFGADLIVPGSRDFATPATASVPPSYILNVGDEINVGLTGSTEGSIGLVIDTDGRVFIPRVGAVTLAGVRYGDLRQTLLRAIGRQYRDFEVSASIGRLRGVRVYVTGFANNPGAYTVSSLSTLLNATLAAGGPSAGGSFRSIQLFRNGEMVTDFDLYDLVRNGDRSRDAILQNEDILFIPPVGQQVALAGSVNQEAIYEAREGETLGDLIRYGGGFNALADPSRAIVYSIANLDTIGGEQLTTAELAVKPARGGDIVQVLSLGTLARPLERQAVLVRVEGEVARPGNYYVQAGTPLSQVMAQAGGVTSRAFVYGTRFERFSVREQQRASFIEAVEQLEVSLAAAPITGDQTIDPATRAQQLAAARQVLERLRRTEPDGRMVLDLAPNAAEVTVDFALENNDRIVVPSRPSTVGVFGAVYRPASFLIDEGQPAQRVRDYLRRAGGRLRVGDGGALFVVRANGSVVSKRNGALDATVLPGDVIFVPTRTQGSTFWQRFRDISQFLFGAGVTAAVIAR